VDVRTFFRLMMSSDSGSRIEPTQSDRSEIVVSSKLNAGNMLSESTSKIESLKKKRKWQMGLEVDKEKELKGREGGNPSRPKCHVF